MAKAHKISVFNKGRLTEEYGLDHGDLDGFEGNYLVAGFGGNPVNGFVNQANLNKFFDIKEINLAEDYYVIEKKDRLVV